jgi:hypothetical protein
MVFYGPGKSDKKQKNHEKSLRIDDGLHMPEIGTPRTCLCHTTGKVISMVNSLYYRREVKLHLITSGDKPGIQDKRPVL